MQKNDCTGRLCPAGEGFRITPSSFPTLRFEGCERAHHIYLLTLWRHPSTGIGCPGPGISFMIGQLQWQGSARFIQLHFLPSFLYSVFILHCNVKRLKVATRFTYLACNPTSTCKFERARRQLPLSKTFPQCNASKSSFGAINTDSLLLQVN